MVLSHDRAVTLSTYLEKKWPCVPIAIPSRSCENDLCDQTLSMLRAYDYDMTPVHIFVDATLLRPDGTNHNDAAFIRICTTADHRVHRNDNAVHIRRLGHLRDLDHFTGHNAPSASDSNTPSNS